MRLIDLEAAKYENQVQVELRKHVSSRIDKLGKEKKYSRALSYFASSLMGKRAQSRQWIDITCVSLAELPAKANDVRIRHTLESMSQNLSTLLDGKWVKIFNSCGPRGEDVKEMLRVLVLTYEDPSEAELGVLVGMPDTEDNRKALKQRVEDCRPLLSVKRSSKGDTRVAFMNVVVKDHLRENAAKLLGLDEEATKWQQGMLGYRCFDHIVEAFREAHEELADGGGNVQEGQNQGEVHSQEPAGSSLSEKPGSTGDPSLPEYGGDGMTNEATPNHDEDENGSDGIVYSEEDYESDTDWEIEEAEEAASPDADLNAEEDVEEKPKVLPYAVKHWLHHSSKATREMAEQLSKETFFWSPSSTVRSKWFKLYRDYTEMLKQPVFEDYNPDSATAIHVAATAGFSQLVDALFRNGYKDLRDTRDNMDNSPLHLAAFLGRPNIVDVLIDAGADVNDGSDKGEDTPLHAAAGKGNVGLMTRLLNHGADVNAVSKNNGPVLNAAIFSGSMQAVKFLMEKGVSLTERTAEERYPYALSLAAILLPDLSMFDHLVKSCGNKLPPIGYSEALVVSAGAGRLGVFDRLIEYEHPQEILQEALELAVLQENWDIILSLLDKKKGLNCDELFVDIASGYEEKDRVLAAIWAHTSGSVPIDKINKSLYKATDNEKKLMVKFLLEDCKADPNASDADWE